MFFDARASCVSFTAIPRRALPFAMALSRFCSTFFRLSSHHFASCSSDLNFGTVLLAFISRSLVSHICLPELFARGTRSDYTHYITRQGPHDEQDAQPVGLAERRPALLAADNLILQVEWMISQCLLRLLRSHAMTSYVSNVGAIPIELDFALALDHPLQAYIRCMYKSRFVDRSRTEIKRLLSR